MYDNKIKKITGISFLEKINYSDEYGIQLYKSIKKGKRKITIKMTLYSLPSYILSNFHLITNVFVSKMLSSNYRVVTESILTRFFLFMQSLAALCCAVFETGRVVIEP